ncbi:hypothetical protein [Gymnodinialimonas ulvae]|uniref:hypothetical protein n=1 Tax=Gymnodinialimonas ulvae TaxID=3126504 RepID=UPI0030951FD0
MESFADLPANDALFQFSRFTWAMIFLGAVALRLLPVLMAIGALVKLRAFPQLRALHILLLIELVLIAALALADTFDLVPGSYRVTGLWSFLWVFAIAWAAVTWTRSAWKTRLHPRWIDIATLACATAVIFAFSATLLPDALTL